MHARRVFCAALATVLAAPAAHAMSRLELSFGGTGASSDGPKQSGMCASVATLWNFGSELELGPTLFYDDLGSSMGTLQDPSTGADLGTIPASHRVSYGGAWRADVPLARRERWRAHLGATWGYYRIQDDHLGVVQDAISAVGWSVGASASRKFLSTTMAGFSVRWNQLREDRQNSYVRATVDLTWLHSAAPDSRASKKATP